MVWVSTLKVRPFGVLSGINENNIVVTFICLVMCTGVVWTGTAAEEFTF